MSTSPLRQRKTLDELLNAPWKLESIAKLDVRIYRIRVLAQYQHLSSSDWIVLDAMKKRRDRLIKEILDAPEDPFRPSGPWSNMGVP